MARRIAWTLIAAGLALGGCAVEDNERLTLGTTVALDEFRPSSPPPASSGPSIEGLDRSHWARTTFLVPVNGVAHTTTYAPPTFELDNTPRQRGGQPTALSALDLGEPDGGEQIEQALRSHWLAMSDAVLLPFRVVYKPLNTTNWSPRWSYERAPEGVTVPPPPEPCCVGAACSCPAEATETGTAATPVEDATGASDAGGA